MSYATQEQVEAYLSRTLTESETITFPTISAYVDGQIDEWLNGSYADVSVTSKYYDGGSKILQIDAVTDVTAIAHVDSAGETITDYDLDLDVTFGPVNDRAKRYVERPRLGFPFGVANIKITGEFHLGDEAELPDSLVYLATYMSARLLSPSMVSFLNSESIEGYSRSFKDIDWANDSIVAFWRGSNGNEINIL